MDMVLGQGFLALEEKELLTIDGGWSWQDTLIAAGAAAVVIGSGIVIAASAPISLPAAVAIGATTGKTLSWVGGIALTIGATSK